MSKPSNKKKVLIIEDDRSLSIVLQKVIEDLGYISHGALDGETGLEKASTEKYSLIISDISLPGISGFTILEKLRTSKITTPTIVITNYNINENEINTYQYGANIFHAKPIHFDLLKAQIEMLMNNTRLGKEQIVIGDILIDPIKNLFIKDTKVIKLSKREFDLMFALMHSPGEIFTRRDIMNITNMARVMEAEESSVDTLISRLRRKLGLFKNGEVIETVYGEGYRLNHLYLE